MNWYLIGLAAGLAAPTFFMWCAIHEVSHFLVADWLIGVKSAVFKLYPNKSEVTGRWRWASVRFKLERVPKAFEQALYSLAPRVPDFQRHPPASRVRRA